MPNDNQNDTIELSRRKILGTAGAIGVAGAGAGLGTSAFFSDQETFTNNQLVAGELDLKVGWKVQYFDWIDSTPRVISQSNFTDQPGPLVQLEDIKPGDVITHTLDAQIVGNPGFLSVSCSITEDSDNGITEPEDEVNGPNLDNSDGTTGGDLGDALRMAVWFDDGDGLPQEIWAGTFPATIEEFIMAVGDADRPSDIFTLSSPNLVVEGTASAICEGPTRLLDPRVNGHVASDFPNSLCYRARDADVESIGVLLWVPSSVGNVIQTDRCEYSIRFNAVQCRHNVANSGGPTSGANGDVVLPSILLATLIPGDDPSDPSSWRIETPSGITATGDNPWSVYDYDERTRTFEVIKPEGNVVTVSYDGMNRQIDTKYDDGTRTKKAYDGSSGPVKVDPSEDGKTVEEIESFDLYVDYLQRPFGP